MKETTRFFSKINPAAGLLLTALFLFVTFNGSLMAATNRMETIISQNFGKTLDDIYGVSQSSADYSPYFSNSSPAFCISSGNGEQYLYILDAMNRRIKKFTLAGNFVSQIPIEKKEIRAETLCGICVNSFSGSDEIMIYSKNNIYILDASGKFSGGFAAPGDAQVDCVFGLKNGKKFIYDGSSYTLSEAFFSGGAVVFEAAAEKISPPAPSGSDSLYSCRLLNSGKLVVIRTQLDKKGLSYEFHCFLSPAGEHISAPRVIGIDELSNVYVRRYSSLSEFFSVISPSGKLLREFSVDPSLVGGRTNMYSDELVDSKGNIYIAFNEKNRFVIKKIFNEN